MMFNKVKLVYFREEFGFWYFFLLQKKKRFESAMSATR